MKLFLLVFSLVILLTFIQCAPQQRRRPRPRPRPQPGNNTRPGAATPVGSTPGAATPPSASTAPAVAVTTSTPPRTTPSQEYFRCLQNCPTTSEYNPICGSNQMVYLNMGKFLCAQSCGSDATLVRKGNCAGLF